MGADYYINTYLYFYTNKGEFNCRLDHMGLEFNCISEIAQSRKLDENNFEEILYVDGSYLNNYYADKYKYDIEEYINYINRANIIKFSFEDVKKIVFVSSAWLRQ